MDTVHKDKVLPRCVSFHVVLHPCGRSSYSYRWSTDDAFPSDVLRACGGSNGSCRQTLSGTPGRCEVHWGGGGVWGGGRGREPLRPASCAPRPAAPLPPALSGHWPAPPPPSPSSEEKEEEGGAGGAGAAGEEVGSSTKFCNLNMKVGCLGEDITEKNGGYIYSGRRQ